MDVIHHLLLPSSLKMHVFHVKLCSQLHQSTRKPDNSNRSCSSFLGNQNPARKLTSSPWDRAQPCSTGRCSLLVNGMRPHGKLWTNASPGAVIVCLQITFLQHTSKQKCFHTVDLSLLRWKSLCSHGSYEESRVEEKKSDSPESPFVPLFLFFFSRIKSMSLTLPDDCSLSCPRKCYSQDHRAYCSLLQAVQPH